MVKNLVIVESPAKAKTIEKFLGSDYTVTSSYGHVRDLVSDEISVDVENNFEPKYQISPDKKKLIKELKKLASDAETVWLATDEDREGEAISWHLMEALDLKEEKCKRIVFHEITKPAIIRAIENPRKLDRNLVNAQQARRVLDRLVGYELSPVLWKKVRPSLSAGRVQSVAVKLIVERERAILDFNPESNYKPKALFKLPDNTPLEAESSHRFKEQANLKEFLASCEAAEYAIEDIQVKPAKKNPAPPFTTSTLQQEASRKLGFSVSKTMTLAQKLYEAGHITYMRTDSVNLSETAIDGAAEEIRSQFGEKYLKTRRFKTKSEGAQEAHEAIRPTYIGEAEKGASYDEKRLYELIWKRTIASQMAEALLEKTTVTISQSNSDYHYNAQGQILKFDGFLKVYLESTDDEDSQDPNDVLLPPLEKGMELKLKEIEARERFTRPPARFTEASLVKQLEELGIGRPSTYAPTISTIQKRDYVKKESRDGKERSYKLFSLKNGEVVEEVKNENYGAEKNKLFPSDVGMLVTDFLDEHFDSVMDYHFTASVESEFDKIAGGGKEWQDMISRFYKPFHERVNHTTKEAKRVHQVRELGTDPQSGLPVLAKFGKYGPYIQIGSNEDEEKPRFAKLRHGQLLENISLEDALELFKLPRTLGTYEDKDVEANVGRYGPYVRHNSKFVSIPKEKDPFEITLDEAIELIETKRKEEANKFINEFEHDGDTIQVLNGRYGPYIKKGRSNFKIPKGSVAEELSLDEVLEIIEKAPAKKKGRRKK